MSSRRYQILGHLASGGMGEILLARRLGPVGFEQLVVLKRPLGATSPGHAAALIDEARLLARIRHPNVCQVHDLEAGDDGTFLVLEYLEGMSWWTLLEEAERAGRPLELAALCGMIEQVCDGLDAIHAVAGRDGRPAGIVHRDISPGNLFLTEAGVAKILDLGIAKTDESNTTAPGAGPKGKLPYLSPEQVAGRAVDRRADVFALGLVVYDLARGRRPGPQRVGAIAASDLALDELPAALAAVIRTAVALDPAARFATAGELAAALRAAAGALGGSLGPAELARWLGARFGAAIAARRARLRSAADGGAAESPSTARRVELRSLVGGAGADAGGDPATAELPRPPPLIQPREHPAIGQVHALVAAGDGAAPPPPRLRRRRPAVAAAVAIAVIAGALGVAVRGRSDNESPRAPQLPAAVPTTAPTTPSTAADLPATGDPTPAAPAPARVPAAPARKSTARPARGRLSIDSDPFAVIDLDGKPLGATPLYQVQVAAGHHVVRAETGDGRVQRREIDVAPGTVSAVILRWTAGADRRAN